MGEVKIAQNEYSIFIALLTFKSQFDFRRRFDG